MHLISAEEVLAAKPRFIYSSRMPVFLKRSSGLVMSVALALTAGGGACTRDQATTPDAAVVSGDAGNGDSTGGTRTDSVGGTTGDGPNGDASVVATEEPKDSREVGIDMSAADGVRGEAGSERSSRDAYSDRDGLALPDLPARQDAALPFWTEDFVADCAPPSINGRPQEDGHHRAGEDCMRSGCHRDPDLAAHHAGSNCRGSGCHANGSPDGSGAPAFLFGGTIYEPISQLAVPGIEVAVRTAEGFFSSCSSSNGNFWRLAPSRTAPPLNWSSASARVRSAAGESVMTTPLTSGCNAALCHAEGQRLTAPAP